MNRNRDMIACMNFKCRATETHRWMTGWGLKSGTSALLCFKCGSSYESSKYCENFHKKETGWRNCRKCEKPIHCGCIASKHLYECLDFGGVWCKTCQQRDVDRQRLPTRIAGSGNTSLDKGKTVSSQGIGLPSFQTAGSTNHAMKQSTLVSSNSNVIYTANDSNNIALVNSGSLNSQKCIASFSTGVNTQEETTRIVELAQNSHSLAKHKIRVSDTELQQIFAALKTKVDPLFEKVLLASDVSKVGKLVIPKVCAMSYFPFLRESTGITLNVIDSNGKKWNFQFRFWNNNGGRMYVFEDTQEYMKESGLQAQDIVMFGVIHPNQLVIGFKKTPVVDKELELTWGQAQHFLQPNPKSTCNIVMVDDIEFEEYDKPPIIENNVNSPQQFLDLPLNDPESPQSPDPKKIKVTDQKSIGDAPSEDPTSIA